MKRYYVTTSTKIATIERSWIVIDRDSPRDRPRICSEHDRRSDARAAAARLNARESWSGLCPAGKHGLDYEGQPCDLCEPEPEPERKIISQCATCPWRKDADPDREIPNGYSRDLHAGLACTISKAPTIPTGGRLRAMACHYAEPGKEYACAGWIHNQMGEGNNIAVRLAVMTGQLPVPKVHGDQHARFEDTLPRDDE